jgi:hypothetical protein
VVGVISDGIDSVQDAQATSDLPDVVVPNDSRCQRGAGDEGTALLEIVHDVAPGAKLLFSGPASSLDMVDAVECLVDAGANVIVDDLGFFGEPYFEDGPVAEAVDAAVAAGVSYHSSAGNEAEEHLEEDFLPQRRTRGFTTSRPAAMMSPRRSWCRRGARSLASYSGTTRSAGPPTTMTCRFLTPT